MYGLRVTDIGGSNVNIITPETATIIASGTATMPNSLNDDDTYGLDIDLPGISAIPTSKIGVFIMPHENIHYENEFRLYLWGFDPDFQYAISYFLDAGNYSYYTKNDSTGVMTSFTPGIRTEGNISTWDGIISIFPLVGWDRPTETITSVRLWAVTAYMIADGLSTAKVVYSIGNSGGIEKIDYAIFMKEWDY